jgi:molybdenum ABC transporter molybdate-binding protein
MKDRSTALAGLALAVVMLMTAAPSASRDEPGANTTLIALVAANATDPINDIIGAFERENPGVRVVQENAGTQVLATQAEQGAPFDIFLSADRKHIDDLAREGLVENPIPVSQTHEVIVVPNGNPAGIQSLHDLAAKPAKLVLGVETVPIGIYTRRILANAAAVEGKDFPARVLSQAVSFETNVKQVLEKVSLGEADAGVVYFTDVTQAFSTKVSIVPIPQKYEVEAVNYIAPAKASRNPALARAFVDYAAGSEGRAIFRRHGYDPFH